MIHIIFVLINHLMIPVDEGAVMRKSTTPRDVSSLDKGDYSDKHCIYVVVFLPLINFFYKQFLNPMKEKKKK